VQFALNNRDLSYVNESGTRMVRGGKYTLTIGGGQPGTKAAAAAAEFEIQGEKQLPR
jgi:beta-glucosidase